MPQDLKTLAKAVWLTLICAGGTLAQLEFEAEPIHYGSAQSSDRVSVLKEDIESGALQLNYCEKNGYLSAVLDHLDVPVSSQVLVFSKTSFQLRRIHPRRPRAVYFNDDVYVGWVQGGDVVEISAVSPELGAVFYTIDQQPHPRPEVIRDQGQCISCHASSRTAGVPGHLVRSVFPGKSGQPYFGSGTYTIDHRSPFDQRWGGWFVTGTHGGQRHMGNAIANRDDHQIDRQSGANLTDLSERIDTDPYLSEHSDIVALMVLEHQTQMHNLITRATYESRIAKHYDQVMNEALERPASHRSDSAKRRMAAAANKLVEYMLFAEEMKITDRISGTSGFADEFAKKGPRDQQGRSLRDFDLASRMMKYPCSYLIYSPAFDGIPSECKDEVYRRLHHVLTGELSKSDADTFSHLSTEDRTSILEILKDTKTDLPQYWRNAT